MDAFLTGTSIKKWGKIRKSHDSSTLYWSIILTCLRFVLNVQALKSVATRSLAESKLNLGVNEPKVVEVSIQYDFSRL